MKAGDLVRMKHHSELAGKVGLVMEERDIDLFVVHIGGRVHPFLVHKISLEKIK